MRRSRSQPVRASSFEIEKLTGQTCDYYSANGAVHIDIDTLEAFEVDIDGKHLQKPRRRDFIPNQGMLEHKRNGRQVDFTEKLKKPRKKPHKVPEPIPTCKQHDEFPKMVLDRILAK